MKLVPLSDRVVLKELEAEETTASGIVLPGQAKEKPQQAEVIAVGPGGVVDGKEVVMNVKVGQRIEKGDELGYFLFGGSDCVMLFSSKTGFELTVQPASSDDTYANGYAKILCRAQYGRFVPAAE